MLIRLPVRLFLLAAMILVVVVSTAASLIAAQTGHPDAVVTAASVADGTRSGQLYEELARMDSVLFDAAFVACDARKTNAILADDVEFYHDREGFTSGERTRATIRALTARCPSAQGNTRVLVPGSLRVYPIANYGAVQVGDHRFVERGAATNGVAQFVHLWRGTSGKWRLARVLSFDHHPTAAVQGPAR